MKLETKAIQHLGNNKAAYRLSMGRSELATHKRFKGKQKGSVQAVHKLQKMATTISSYEHRNHSVC